MHPRQSYDREEHVQNSDDEEIQMLCSSFLQSEKSLIVQLILNDYCLLVLRIVNDSAGDVLVHVEQEGKEESKKHADWISLPRQREDRRKRHQRNFWTEFKHVF